MNNIKKLLPFLKPYWKLSVISLILLTTVLLIDLSIPRLIQKIIDQGVNDRAFAAAVRTGGWE
jgi:ATP-binding cassette subfamily B multidrug efflux pump